MTGAGPATCRCAVGGPVWVSLARLDCPSLTVHYLAQLSTRENPVVNSAPSGSGHTASVFLWPILWGNYTRGTVRDTRPAIGGYLTAGSRRLVQNHHSSTQSTQSTQSLHKTRWVCMIDDSSFVCSRTETKCSTWGLRYDW